MIKIILKKINNAMKNDEIYFCYRINGKERSQFFKQKKEKD
jgi:hypothetical protein